MSPAKSRKPARKAAKARKPAPKAAAKRAKKAKAPARSSAPAAAKARPAVVGNGHAHCAASDPFGDPCQNLPRRPSKYCVIHSYLER